MYVKLDGREVSDVKLRIYEPPRFFEALLRGRAFTEAPDITARICGICPVAYQMSAVRAMEDACGVRIDDGPLRDLRRLLYCGEWIESHSLHVYMLHAPDFLGYASAVEMAARPPRDRRTGPADEEGRQRPDGGRRGPRDPPDQRARRRLLPRADARRELRALREPLERGARDGARDRALGRDAPVPRRRARTRAARAVATRPRLPDRPRARSSPTAASTSPRRSSTSTSSRSTSSTPTRCTRACASAAPT